jgi:spore coat protein U-like protein
MSFRKLVLVTRAALAMVAGLGIATSSWGAPPATNPLAVSASVSQVCTITTTAVAFAAYDPVVANASAALAAQGTVVVTCTSGSSTAVTIGLNTGANNSGSIRRMKDGANYLTYELYQPSATTPSATCPGTIVWTTTAGAGLLTPSGTTWGATSPQTFNVCGVVPGGQNAVVGTGYADTVLASVNF